MLPLPEPIVGHVAGMCGDRATRSMLGFHVDRCVRCKVAPLPVVRRPTFDDALAARFAFLCKNGGFVHGTDITFHDSEKNITVVMTNDNVYGVLRFTVSTHTSFAVDEDQVEMNTKVVAALMSDGREYSMYELYLFQMEEVRVRVNQCPCRSCGNQVPLRRLSVCTPS